MAQGAGYPGGQRRENGLAGLVGPRTITSHVNLDSLPDVGQPFGTPAGAGFHLLFCQESVTNTRNPPSR